MADNSKARISIYGMCGSLRRQSYNAGALRAAVELAPEGISIDIGTLADTPPANPIGAFPLYNEDVRQEGIPEEVKAMGAKIAAADAILFCCPEYNFSMPGVFKNALDWLSRLDPMPFDRKPFAIISASLGMLGGARSQYNLRQAALFLNMHALNKPEVFIGLAKTKFDDQGRLTDETTRDFIRTQLNALRDWTIRLRE